MAEDSGAALQSMFGRPEDGIFSGAMADRRAAHLQYWVKPDGFIERGPSITGDAPGYERYIEVKRYRPLPTDFGKELLNPGRRVTDGTLLSPKAGRDVVGREHWWLKPFFEKGGLTYICRDNDSFGRAGEYLMSKAQLVQLGLHRDPEVRKMRPDLDTAVDLECDYKCVDERGAPRKFSGVNHEIARRSVDQHIVAVHKDTVAHRAVGDAVANALKSNGGTDPNLIASIVGAVLAALKPTEVAAVAATQVVSAQQTHTARLAANPEDDELIG